MIRSADVERVWILAVASKCESMSVLSAVGLALVGVLTCVIMVWAHPGGPAWGSYYTRRRTNGPRIPGPRGLPMIGSMELMRGLAHHKLGLAAAGCGARRLMAFSLGQTRAVVTCNPDVAREILNSGTFSDRPVKESAYRLMFNRSIGFAPYGVYWTALRKMAAQHLFCPSQVRASREQRLRIASQVVALLANQNQGGPGPTRLRDVLKLASLNNMMSSVFGREVSADAAELQDLVDQGYHLLGLVNWSDHLPFLADLDLQNIRLTCSRLVPRVNRFVGRIIAQRMEAAPTAAAADFLDVMLSLPPPHRLSDSDMIAVLWVIIKSTIFLSLIFFSFSLLVTIIYCHQSLSLIQTLIIFSSCPFFCRTRICLMSN